jgi:hypothetical protein
VLDLQPPQRRAPPTRPPARAGKQFDVLGVTRGRQQGRPPGLGVFASWLGGLPGWLAGGWWWQQRELTQGQLEELKTREIKNGRLAMWVAGGWRLAGAWRLVPEFTQGGVPEGCLCRLPPSPQP